LKNYVVSCSGNSLKWGNLFFGSEKWSDLLTYIKNRYYIIFLSTKKDITLLSPNYRLYKFFYWYLLAFSIQHGIEC